MGRLERRTFFPKGNAAKAVAIQDCRLQLNGNIIAEIVKICQEALIQRFKKRKPLGKCYLDKRLKGYVVPFSQRSASKAFKTIVRGSKIPLKNSDTIRVYLWWTEKGGTTGRIDVDLSAVAYTSTWGYHSHISYTNLKENGIRAYHSGDITSAPKGAAEFIDLDMASLKKAGIRYVVFCIFSFTQQKFSDMPQVFAGWMTRRKPNSGEIFEPKTLKNRFDITSESKFCIPLILDTSERKAIWCDIGCSNRINHCNNLENHQRSIVSIGRAMTNLRKPDLYRLLKMHIAGRGELVEDPAEAQHVFSVANETHFDYENIISNLISENM